jgi:predicted outer membrane protein
MRRGIVRSAVAALLGLMVLVWPAVGTVLAGQTADADTLTALDKEFLTVIRFANLWEAPMGKLATERGTTKAVKDTGKVLSDDHTQLDIAVKKLGVKFNVELPNEPTPPQKSWIAEISSKTGPDFDRTWADRLRAAHGTVFGLVAEVRAGTRNADIRAFAQTANDIVMKHMTLLEGTGLVAPNSMFAEAAARSASNPENTLTRSQILMAVLLGFVMLVVTLGLVRTLSARGPAER